MYKSEDKVRVKFVGEDAPLNVVCTISGIQLISGSKIDGVLALYHLKEYEVVVTDDHILGYAHTEEVK